MLCSECGDTGYFLCENGNFQICKCRKLLARKQYVNSLKSYVSSTVPSTGKCEVQDFSQALIFDNNVMRGLLLMIANKWYPIPFGITTMEECNEVGFHRHPIYQSISSLANSNTNFIIDISIYNKVRAKNSSLNQYDTLYLLDFISTIINRNKGKVIIIIDKRVKSFFSAFPDLIDGLSTMGIQYFDGKQYRDFPRLEVLSSEGDLFNV